MQVQVPVQVQAEPTESLPPEPTRKVWSRNYLSCLKPRQGLGQTQALLPTPYLSGIGKMCTICLRSPGRTAYATEYLKA